MHLKIFVTWDADGSSLNSNVCLNLLWTTSVCLLGFKINNNKPQIITCCGSIKELQNLSKSSFLSYNTLNENINY